MLCVIRSHINYSQYSELIHNKCHKILSYTWLWHSGRMANACWILSRRAVAHTVIVKSTHIQKSICLNYFFLLFQFQFPLIPFCIITVIIYLLFRIFLFRFLSFTYYSTYKHQKTLCHWIRSSKSQQCKTWLLQTILLIIRR